MAFALLAVTACAPAPQASAPQPTTPSARKTRAAATGADCTRADKTTIVESSGRYSFTPRTLTIQRGGFLAITNKSDEVHALVTKPDAGIVTSVINLRERQVIQFPDEGTFTVESRSAAHRAVLKVTVSGESGCGTPKPTLTVTPDNAFTPTRLTLTATQNFTVVNHSDTPQTVICTPDPGGNGDHSRLEPEETQLLAIDKPGRYTCSSIQHPGVKATVTVKDA